MTLSVQTLKTIPVRWCWMKLKNVASLKSGESISSDSINDAGDYPVFGGNGIRGYTDAYTHSGKFVLIGRQGALCGNINYASGDFWASEHAVVVTVKGDYEINWIGHLLRSMNLNRYSQAAAQPGISVEVVANLSIPVPPRHEQSVIADYLDRETARIDALVAEKERMLALLEEKRAALISQVVTRGLNPDVPLKPSGLDWLGDIPAHWDVIRLGFLISLQGGSTPATSKDHFWDGSIPWASPKDIKQSVLFDTIDHVSKTALLETGLSMIAPPVVLLVVRGMILAKNIPTSLTAVPMTINQDMKALRPLSNSLYPEYLKLLFDGLQEPLFTLIEESAHGTRCFRTDLLTTFKIPLPPSEEQQALLAQVGIADHELKHLGEALKRSMVLLKERRAALITAAVTGQIPIKEMAA